MNQAKYNMNWHTSSDHLSKTLKEMMTTNLFADVTLITEDKKHLKAHRHILSACSQFFKNILTFDAVNNHSEIYLTGIQYSDMESILQFIYLGETRFNEERINELSSIAKNFDIRELSKCLEARCPNVSKNKVRQERAIILLKPLVIM